MKINNKIKWMIKTYIYFTKENTNSNKHLFMCLLINCYSKNAVRWDAISHSKENKRLKWKTLTIPSADRLQIKENSHTLQWKYKMPRNSGKQFGICL